MDVLFLISLYLYTCILTDAIQIRFMTFKDYCLLFFITITISSLSSSCTFSIETDPISHHIVILWACNVVSTNNIVLSVTPIFYQSKRSFYLLLLHFAPYHSCYYLLSNSNNRKYCTPHYQLLGFTWIFIINVVYDKLWNFDCIQTHEKENLSSWHMTIVN